MNKLKLTFVIFSLALAFSAYSQANPVFQEMEHDFSKVNPGSDTLWHEFKFVNKGNEPFFISDVRTSCDCTLAIWPKDPIQPGKPGVIKGGFKIEGKSGEFEKSIIIFGNTTPATTILNIKGNIIEPPVNGK